MVFCIDFFHHPEFFRGAENTRSILHRINRKINYFINYYQRSFDIQVCYLIIKVIYLIYQKSPQSLYFLIFQHYYIALVSRVLRFFGYQLFGLRRRFGKVAHLDCGLRAFENGRFSN